MNRRICQLDTVLCKEEMQHKTLSQEQVLGYEGGSGTEGQKPTLLLKRGTWASFCCPQKHPPRSTSAMALAQGFWPLRADSVPALAHGVGWWHSHVCLSLTCVNPTAGQEILQPIHRLSK